MIDVVYALGTGSFKHDFEIRMSLRSIEKYLSGVRHVWIIGERPEWLQNINHLHAIETSKIPDTNIHSKIALACNWKEVSDEFLFMNDDHYLLSPFEAETFPYFFSGTMEQFVGTRSDGYGRRVKATLSHLKSKDLPTKYFDMHYPIRYNKAAYIQHVSTLPWDTAKDGYVIKSLYANSLKIEGTEQEDNKVNTIPPIKSIAFSSYPHMKALVQRFLTEQFHTKSRFET